MSSIKGQFARSAATAAPLLLGALGVALVLVTLPTESDRHANPAWAVWSVGAAMVLAACLLRRFLRSKPLPQPLISTSDNIYVYLDRWTLGRRATIQPPKRGRETAWPNNHLRRCRKRTPGGLPIRQYYRRWQRLFTIRATRASAKERLVARAQTTLGIPTRHHRRGSV